MLRVSFVIAFLLLLPWKSFGSSPLVPISYEIVSGGEDPYRLLSQAESIFKKDPAKALDLIEEALLMAIRQNNLNAQGDSYDLLGDINFHLQQYDLAAANYQGALLLFKRTENVSQQLQMYLLSGRSYDQAGDLDKALASYRAYVQLAESSNKEGPNYKLKRGYRSSLKDDKLTAMEEVETVKLAIAEILIKQKKYEESVVELGNVAESVDTIQNPENSLIINEKLGEVYIEQDMEEEAVQYYNRNLSTARKLNKPQEEAKATSKLADIYGETEMTDEALNLRNRSIEIYSLNNDSSGLARQYLARGKLQQKINQPDQAEQSFSQALEYAIKSGDKQVERETYNEVSALEEERGRTRKALEYYKKYVALQDEAFRERQQELEQTLALNSSLNQQQQRIELLEKNEEINNKTIEVLRANEIISKKSTTNQRLIIYGLVLVILLLGISGYFMYNNMRRKRVANQLLALKSLRSQMNPHFIFNALNSVNHYISQQDERTANKYLSDFSRLMRSVLENSQKDFIPLAREIEIIELYLQLEHNRFRDKFTYNISVAEDLDKEHIQIPPMLVQPYVENAIWHGLRYRDDKGILHVNYGQSEGNLRITVEDNGIGREQSMKLKTANQKKSISTGMSNIEHRVNIINKMYHTSIEAKVIDLPEGSGTRIELVIPEINTEQTV